jgi:hypothetical protein
MMPSRQLPLAVVNTRRTVRAPASAIAQERRGSAESQSSARDSTSGTNRAVRDCGVVRTLAALTIGHAIRMAR